MINMLKKTFLAVAAVSAMGFVTGASATVIDLFSQPGLPGSQAVEVSNGPTSVSAEYFNNDGSIIGSYRDLILSATGTTANRTSSLAVEDGRLLFSNDTGVTGTGIVQWDGQDVGDASVLRYGLNANLVVQEGCPITGCSFFQATVFYADQGFGLELGVFTSEDQFSLLRFVTASVDNPMGVPSIFEFSWFDTAGLNQQVEPGFFVDVIHGAGGAADFTNVGALQLILNTTGTVAVDLELGAIEKNGQVPEPGALALVGVGLLGAAVAGRRRKALKA